MFLISICAALLLNTITCAPQQQGAIFNQNPFNRGLPINRPQPFQPNQALLQQPNYQAYNPRNYVPITSYQNDVSYDGSFSYGYTTGDGTTAQAQGYLKNAGRKDLEAQVVQGSYSYTSPDGTPIRVDYIADENGFRAEGAHIPTPPPIPDAIAKSLQYIARIPQGVYNQNLNPQGGYNQNLNAFQNTQIQQQQFQQQQRQNQLTPIQLQQKQLQQQQQNQSGQYQPEQQFQQTDQQRQGQQPFQTQQFQSRPNQIPQISQIPTQFGFNKFGRFKK